MSKKLLLYGIGSYKNRGVEAIVQSALNQIPENTELDVACYDVDFNKERYNDKVKKYIKHRTTYEELPLETRQHINKLAENKDYFSIESIYQKELIDVMPKYDIFISAGGDNYCYDANDWLFTIDKSVKLNNKKLLLFGASLYEKIENEDLIRDLDLFDVLHIRESISYNELKNYISEDKLVLAPDTAFSLPIKEVKLDKWYKNRKVVGLNFSPTVLGKKNVEQRLNDVIGLVKYILDTTNYSVSLISHVTIDESNDYKTMSEIYESFKDNDRVFLERDDYNCNEVKYVISKCELMIAARTHASIAAYSTCVPTLVLGYSVKSKGIATDLFGTDKNYVVAFDDLYYENLIEKFDWLNNNKTSIKKRLEEVIPDFRERSKQAFSLIMEKLELQEKKKICDKKECINCGLCKNTCSLDAVVDLKDNLDYVYKERDIDKCINCGKCIKMCPINSFKNKKNEDFNKVCYAAKNKDIATQKKSSSGGVFSLLAEEVLKNNGIVYGVERVDNKTKHIRINNIKDLDRIRGSKYTQSSMLDILDQIKKDNKDNKKILFSGTPCQVAAIKRLLGESKNITYVAVVCHGVLNDELVEKYLNNNNLKLDSFRCKDNGWSISSIKYNNKVVKFMDDDLMGLYVNNVILRESCYRCKFQLDNTKADIILGDFWGIKEINEEIFDENGVSAVIITTIAGNKLFTKIKNKLQISEMDINYIKSTNPCLVKPVEKPKKRFIFNDLIKDNSWESINKIEKQEREIKKIKEQLSNVQIELNNKCGDLDTIKNSKRWKMINKYVDFLNRFRKNK